MPSGPVTIRKVKVLINYILFVQLISKNKSTQLVDYFPGITNQPFMKMTG